MRVRSTNKAALIYLACLLSTVTAAGTALAGVLGSVHDEGGGGGSSPSEWYMRGFVDANGENLLSFFETPVYANVGETVWYDATTGSPDFARVVGYLTDGIDEYIGIEVYATGGGHSHGVAESELFTLGTGYPDLKGQVVNRIGFRVDDATVSAQNTQYWQSVTLLIDGEVVPEPSTLFSLLCSVCAIASFRCRRR